LIFAYILLSGFFDISDTLFPPQFCTKFDIVKSLWVNYVLADEAYFHCTLAISASYVDFYERKPGVSLQSLHHISRAYALVNLKLSGRESVSDRAIAAVVSLAIYQQIHHLHSTGLIHLNGLYRMIQLRGGIARLMQENRALALKPMRYVHVLASTAFSSFFLRFVKQKVLRLLDSTLSWRCKPGYLPFFAAMP
jgi:hypothetical protein